MTDRSQDPEFQRRLLTILDSYLIRRSAGATEAREEMLAKHPDLRVHLEQLLANLEDGSLVDPAGWPPPHELEDYEILREIGAGGMAVVYEARQRSLNRVVALKVLRPHLSISRSLSMSVSRPKISSSSAAAPRKTSQGLRSSRLIESIGGDVPVSSSSS